MPPPSIGQTNKWMHACGRTRDCFDQVWETHIFLSFDWMVSISHWSIKLSNERKIGTSIDEHVSIHRKMLLAEGMYMCMRRPHAIDWVKFGQRPSGLDWVLGRVD